MSIPISQVENKTRVLQQSTNSVCRSLRSQNSAYIELFSGPQVKSHN